MKRLLCLLCFVLLVTPVKILNAEEKEAITSGNWEYILLDDGTVEITECTIERGTIDIPSSIDGKKVSSIGDDAIYFKDHVGAINIPEGIASIGDSAFVGCGIRSITLPDSITSIGKNPFGYCHSLSKIEISPNHPTLAVIDGALYFKPEKRLVSYPEGLSINSYTVPQGITTIGGSAFVKNKKVTKIIIPDSVTTICDYAFAFSALSNVSIPDSVTTIGNGAFRNTRLWDIIIPGSVTTIGNEAFGGCDFLNHISISEGVTSIGDNAFSGSRVESISIPDSVISIGKNPLVLCEKLTKIEVSPNHPELIVLDGVLFSKSDKRLICYPIGSSFNSYEVPKGIDCIGAGAFSGSKLVNISIPETVNSIEGSAFSSCKNLRSIAIARGVTAIGDFAFSKCEWLSELSIPDSVTSIGKWAFYECKNLTSISIPASVDSIGDDVFKECRKLVTITVPRDSFAEEYCKENGLTYTYTDSLDWLNN